MTSLPFDTMRALHAGGVSSCGAVLRRAREFTDALGDQVAKLRSMPVPQAGAHIDPGVIRARAEDVLNAALLTEYGA